MKSQQKEDEYIGMTCNGCVFAEYEDTIQYGCSAHRIQKFSDEGSLTLSKQETSDDKTVYTLNRFCNLYRDKEWLEKQQKQDAENECDLLTIAQKEIEPVFGIVIYDRNVTGRNLKKTIESIKNLDYDKKKIFVIINYIPHPSREDVNIEHFVEITNDINIHGIRTECVLNKLDEPRIVDYNAFSKCSFVSHVVQMDSLSEIPRDMLKDINMSLNVDMEKIILYRHKSISCVAFPVVNSEYLNHNDFSKMLSSIESAAKHVNMIKNV